MSFADEFSFLPPELVFRTHRLIEAFHGQHGSGPRFRANSFLNSVNSPYLIRTSRLTVTQFKLMQIALVAAVAVLVAGIFLSRWVLFSVPLFLGLAFILYRRWAFGLVEIRAIVLAVEMLADDFAAWGAMFPDARARAEEWLGRSEARPDERLLPLYVREDQRAEFARFFGPSSGSRAAAEHLT